MNPDGKHHEHRGHCLVAMPTGRTPQECAWFKGWYEKVIKPALALSGYVPILPSASESSQVPDPVLMAHLAGDPMMIVDLGGMTPEAGPDPHVMYALGVRHALGLPVVLLAWKGQSLPLGVSGDDVIQEGRALIDLADNRTRLRAKLASMSKGPVTQV